MIETEIPPEGSFDWSGVNVESIDWAKKKKNEEDKDDDEIDIDDDGGRRCDGQSMHTRVDPYIHTYIH